VLLFEADEPDHLEDVTQFVDAKLAALLEHRSQLRSTMGIAEANAVEDGEHPEVLEFKRRVIDRLAENGRKAASPRPKPSSASTISEDAPAGLPAASWPAHRLALLIGRRIAPQNGRDEASRHERAARPRR